MLEDFGDKKISRIKNKNNILYLLRKSIDLLIQIQSYKPDNSIQEFSSDEIVDETIMFVDWFMKKEKNKNKSKNKKRFYKYYFRNNKL